MTGQSRPLVAYGYPVGTKVEGVDAAGQRFAGTVTGIIGPYSVWVDGVGTPVSLITTPHVDDDIFDYDDSSS